ncbi:MAG: bifunctional 4-hydroxy-2-oxoglutarate aldolase/2-dehydro-3-deoxy-phosphogluconate aldolase [Planctomycetes bacterium]|nr:bifunctional 4-hydroxy-2-oxoglutarate aldolase/2-dehydro-3-deoxy-phosphogluconate aldolase [Planctomycetota bacterium]
MDISQFKKLPIMGILRGVESDIIEPLTETIVSSGLRTIEITMNTPGAPNLIRQMSKVADGRLTIGAGTVLTMDDLQQALDAGATFIVLPTLVPEVVEYCTSKAIPVFPGALTPLEINNAWEVGATMVKVFPAKVFGPEYFKEIKGPFSDVELLACGGVNPDNIREFFWCGASAIAFGGSVFKSESLRQRDFQSIEINIKEIINKGGIK